ncbi:MAG TPA: divalent-cation tolerance protein CutA [Pedococcus sp.]
MPSADQPALLEVRISAPDAEVAQALADLLVGERLAACAQLVPITSTYRWQGAVETEPEVLVLAKTTAARFAAICARVRAEHPYDNPEILALPVAAAAEPYAAWLADAVSED